jgi:ribonuclease J
MHLPSRNRARRRPGLPAARRRRRDRHEPQPVWLWRRPLADGRLRHLLRRTRPCRASRPDHGRPGFIAERRDKLVGLVITHAHEDHIGAVSHLWPHLRCPIYATPFTAAVLRRKLARPGCRPGEDHRGAAGGDFDIGPFATSLHHLTHSIPEPNALVIRTPAGTVLHTGDWKLDPSRWSARPPTRRRCAPGRRGRDARSAIRPMRCAPARPGPRPMSASLIRAGRPLRQPGRHHLLRLQRRPHRIGRAGGPGAAAFALVGRSLWRMERRRARTAISRARRRSSRGPGGDIPRDKILLICTGSQGEPRSALTRIAARRPSEHHAGGRATR